MIKNLGFTNINLLDLQLNDKDKGRINNSIKVVRIDALLPDTNPIIINKISIRKI